MEVKDELARAVYPSPCCRKAELATLLRMCAEHERDSGEFYFFNRNAAVTRKALVLLKREMPGIRTDVLSKRSTKLKKSRAYGLKIHLYAGDEQETFWQAVTESEPEKPLAFIRKSCCREAALRGAFLAGGTVNRPEAVFHLEIGVGEEKLANFFLGILKRRGFPAGITERKGKFVVYLKEGEAILDFLDMLHADRAVESLEVGRNVREVRGQVNRLVNCETANLEKTVAAAARQLSVIDALVKSGKISELSEAQQEAAKARLQNPESSIMELAKLLYISKSAMNIRLRKLEEAGKKMIIQTGRS